MVFLLLVLAGIGFCFCFFFMVAGALVVAFRSRRCFLRDSSTLTIYSMAWLGSRILKNPRASLTSIEIQSSFTHQERSSCSCCCCHPSSSPSTPLRGTLRLLFLLRIPLRKPFFTRSLSWLHRSKSSLDDPSRNHSSPFTMKTIILPFCHHQCSSWLISCQFWKRLLGILFSFSFRS